VLGFAILVGLGVSVSGWALYDAGRQARSKRHSRSSAPCTSEGQPISWVALAYELERDWLAEEIVADVVEIVLTERLARA